MTKNRLNPRFFASVRIITAIILSAALLAACNGSGMEVTPTEPGGSSDPTSPPEETQAAPPENEPADKPELTDCQFSPAASDEEYELWIQNANCAAGVMVGMPNTQRENRPVDLAWVAETERSDGFQLNRRIINFEVLDPEDVIVSEFEGQPVRLYIAMTGSDVASVEENFNALVYAYLNEKTDTWVRFTDVENGYSLLRRTDDGYVIWQDSTWVPVTEDTGRYYFGDQEILVEQLEFAFDSLSSTPEFFGVAFVYINGWGDRHIGAGE